MKIAIYVSSWPSGSEASGIVTYAHELVLSLRAMGHEVFVLTPLVTEQDAYTVNVSDIRCSLFSHLRDLLYSKITSVPLASLKHSSRIARAVCNLVNEKDIDVFEMEESFGWAYQICLMNRIPTVVRLHGPFFLTGQFDDAQSDMQINNLREQREGKAIAAAHYITSSSLSVLRDVEEHYSIELTRSDTIPLPIRAKETSAVWDVKTCNKTKILYVGRFDSRKGGDLILRVFAELASTNPDLYLTFVGPDPGIKTDGEPIHFEEFVLQNFDASLRRRIDYRGQMKHDELMALRTQHYMTVVASQYETMGYMLLEAMSLGCPIVTTAVGPIPEVIEDEHNGLLVPSQDLAAMVKACQRLLENPELAVSLGRQARLDCISRYGPAEITSQTIAAYQNAINLFKQDSGRPF